MRIISGKYKGRRFDLPTNFKARPTTDFAKENLFNILNNRVDWEETSILDLFGGTGSISFEFLSRGCRKAVCVEKNVNHCNFIEKVKEKLNIEFEMNLVRIDAFKYLSITAEKFDVIFADPPYDLPNFDSIPRIILESNLLNYNGLFILEHSKEYDFSSLPLFSEKRIYGSVNFSIFENKV